MEDIVVNSPRDVLVNIIMKALGTGMKTRKRWSGRDEIFFGGRVSAFVYDAAQIAHLMYGVQFESTRHDLIRKVKFIRQDWPLEDLTDASKVGNEATTIVSQILQEV